MLRSGELCTGVAGVEDRLRGEQGPGDKGRDAVGWGLGVLKQLLEASHVDDCKRATVI